jgi:putative ABC transport system permease protein
VKDPERVLVMWQKDDRKGVPLIEVSLAEYDAWRASAKSFTEQAAMTATNFRLNLTGSGEPVQVEGAGVSGRFFEVLGLKPAAGRFFAAHDDKVDAAPAAVISEELWRRQFGGDPGIVGRVLTLDGEPATVVGVVPRGLPIPAAAEIFFPVNLMMGDSEPARTLRIFKVVGRLKEGVTLEEARLDMGVVSGRLAQEDPQRNAGLSASVTTLPEMLYGETRRALTFLLGAVGLVLLIACVNVANLLLAGSARREREIAVRSALGAGRWRVARQLLTESLLLALFGAAAGLLLARAGIALASRRLPVSVAAPDSIAMDGRVLLFAAAVALLSAAVFGLFPAFRAARRAEATHLREATSTEGLRANRLRSGLIVAEIALSLALLFSAGLLAKSFSRLAALEPGFDPKDVLTARFSLIDKTYPDGKARAAFFHRVVEKMESLPEVESAGLVLLRPLSDPIGWDYPYTIEGQTPEEQEKNPPSNYESITPGYFSALRIPLKVGRGFAPEDGQSGRPPAYIVSESMAKRYWPGQDPIGKRLKIGRHASKQPWGEVIGVVGDVRYRAWQSIWPDIYVPVDHWNFRRMDLVVRTKGDALAAAATVRAAMRELDASQPLASVTTLEQAVDEALARPRFTALLLALFAGLAVLLASVGIYAVVSGSIARRTREIGVRMALGARPANVQRLVLGETAILAGLGLAGGLLLTLASARVLRGLLFGVGTADPAILAGAAAGIAAVALAAAWVPARRASRVAPLEALREE